MPILESHHYLPDGFICQITLSGLGGEALQVPAFNWFQQ